MIRKQRESSDWSSDWGHKKSRRFEEWGDMMKEEPGKRIFLRVKPHIGMRDLKNFFDESRIEYISLKDNTAIIQFKRPADVSVARELDGKTLKNFRITIEEYRKFSNDRNAQLERERERMIIRSSMKDPLEKYRKSTNQEKSNEFPTKDLETDNLARNNPMGPPSTTDPYTTTTSLSMRTHPQYHNPLQAYYGHSESQVARPQQTNQLISQQESQTGQINPQLQYGAPNNHRSGYSQTVHEQDQTMDSNNSNNHTRRPQRHNTIRDIPMDVEASLRMVLEHKTARNLSEVQIQDIMRYFDYIKTFKAQNIARQEELNEARESDDKNPANKSRRTKRTEAVEWQPPVEGLQKDKGSPVVREVSNQVSEALDLLSTFMRS